MALTLATVEILRKLIATIPHRPLRMACAGYPDVLVAGEQIATMFGAEVAAATQARPDSDTILRWDGLAGKIDQVAETKHFLSLLGIEATFFDIAQVRGDEIVQDLNVPLRPELEQKFDIVFDGGTMEHCFNVAQAILNFLRMAKVGGYVMHSNPFNMPNHGFYNFNPTFYVDFYGENGHEIIGDIAAYSNNVLSPSFAALPKTDRFKSNLPEASLLVVVRKTNDRPPAWPMQTKYKKHPTLTD